ncbi:transposase [Sphaerisporangium sp. NBC_01403]|uniref:Tn3 family transposase n=1 Tax=Sphaerisporangium sp. NBC_01403 TaxID=2903599 RepID=UPI0032513B7D
MQRLEDAPVVGEGLAQAGGAVPARCANSLFILDAIFNLDGGPKPETVISDTGSYSDIVFGLFAICGYQFSPRIADLADTRLWRTNTRAVYGPLEHMSRHTIRLDRTRARWGDMVRVAGSLTTGSVRAYDLIRMLSAGGLNVVNDQVMGIFFWRRIIVHLIFQLVGILRALRLFRYSRHHPYLLIGTRPHPQGITGKYDDGSFNRLPVRPDAAFIIGWSTSSTAAKDSLAAVCSSVWCSSARVWRRRIRDTRREFGGNLVSDRDLGQRRPSRN